ncbi:MAG: hypothetical protein U5Q44_10040 [Dehalococcoidia bacterium]|nr:hypothetical protein [Dehalococcoidia bacterium]
MTALTADSRIIPFPGARRGLVVTDETPGDGQEGARIAESAVELRDELAAMGGDGPGCAALVPRRAHRGRR